MKLSFRTSLLLAVLIGILAGPACAQWNLEWSAAGIDNNAVSGWLSFQQSGGSWQMRFYTLDSLQFKVMDAAYSTIAQYTYTFSLAERLAGASLYSLGLDLTGDGITEFYVLSGYGTATAYRQAARIFDITTNTTVFELNTGGISYSYPTLMDTDNDNLYEAVFIRFELPRYRTIRLRGLPDQHGGRRQCGERGPCRSDWDSDRTTPILSTRRRASTTNWPHRATCGWKSPTCSASMCARWLILRSLRAGTPPPGTARGDTGQNATTGAYFYRLELDGKVVETKQMLLLK